MAQPDPTSLHLGGTGTATNFFIPEKLLAQRRLWLHASKSSGRGAWDAQSWPRTSQEKDASIMGHYCGIGKLVAVPVPPLMSGQVRASSAARQQHWMYSIYKYTRLIDVAILAIILLVLVRPSSAQCKAIVRLQNGLWSATDSVQLLKNMSVDSAPLGAWSPDGKYIFYSPTQSTLEISNAEGKMMVRVDTSPDNSDTELTQLGWSDSNIVWTRVSGRSGSLYGYWKLSLNRGGRATLEPMEINDIGGFCAFHDREQMACITDSIVVNRQRIYPELDPKYLRGIVDARPGQAIRIPANPARDVRVVSTSQDGLEIELPTSSSGNIRLYANGDDLTSLNLDEEADWRILPRRLSNRLWQISLYKFPSRHLVGATWDSAGTRLAFLAISSSQTELFVFSRKNQKWTSVELALPVSDHTVLQDVETTSRPLSFEREGEVTILYNQKRFRCCVSDTSSCHSGCVAIPSKLPPYLPLDHGDLVQVLDWHCSD
jgi:hypothetical protein